MSNQIYNFAKRLFNYQSKSIDIKNNVPLTAFEQMIDSFTGVPSSSQKSESLNIFNLRQYTDGQLLALNYMFINELLKTVPLAYRLASYPVQVAFKNDPIITTIEPIQQEEIKQVVRLFKKSFDGQKSMYEVFKDACILARAYGGAIILIDNNEAIDKELSINDIINAKKISFTALDLWQVQRKADNFDPENLQNFYNPHEKYYFNNTLIHPSRVIKINNPEIEIPFYRKIFKGWNLSIFDSLRISLFQYLKINELLPELLQEMKISLYKIEMSGMTSQTTRNQLFQLLNAIDQMKSYKKAVILDKNAEFEQKQLQFSGMSEPIEQSRKTLCIDSGWTTNFILGEGASGFSSGQDYLESDERKLQVILNAYSPYVQQILRIPMLMILKQDVEFDVSFDSLRAPSPEQLQNTVNQTITNILNLKNAGLLTTEQALQELKENKCFKSNIQIDEIDFLEDNIDEGQEKNQIA